MTTEQQYDLLRQRRQRYQRARRCNEAESSVSGQNGNHRNEISLFYHPSIVKKTTKFHDSLMRLEPVKCLLCLI